MKRPKVWRWPDGLGPARVVMVASCSAPARDPRVACQIWLRSQLPPIEPDVRFSLIRLTDVLHRQRFGLGADTVPASLTSPSRVGESNSIRRPNHRPRFWCLVEMNSTMRSVTKYSMASKEEQTSIESAFGARLNGGDLKRAA